MCSTARLVAWWATPFYPLRGKQEVHLWRCTQLTHLTIPTNWHDRAFFQGGWIALWRSLQLLCRSINGALVLTVLRRLLDSIPMVLESRNN